MGEFRGLALLQHQWDQPLRTEGGGKLEILKLSPRILLEAADEIDISLISSGTSTRQGSVRALWVAAEFAKAPLPAFWTVSNEEGRKRYTRVEGESCDILYGSHHLAP